MTGGKHYPRYAGYSRREEKNNPVFIRDTLEIKRYRLSNDKKKPPPAQDEGFCLLQDYETDEQNEGE